MPREKFQTLTEQMFYILLCLRETCCGADIMEQVRAITNGRVAVGPGTLYHLLDSFVGAGMIEEVQRLLGRWYTISGVVQQGKQLGRRLDFPTANLRWDRSKALPPKGVYAALAFVRGTWYMAAVNIGEHPTAPGGRMTVEANLIGYEGGEFYGCHMRLLLCRRLRAEKKFDSLEALREEVMRNREQVRAYFDRTEHFELKF